MASLETQKLALNTRFVSINQSCAKKLTRELAKLVNNM